MAGTIIADAVQAASTSQLNIKNGVALTPPTISDVNNVAIGTFCRAWVNFNGTGTVAIRASFNVSSITDNGVGDYTLNFTNAMPDVNYAFVGALIGTTASTLYCPRVLETSGNPTLQSTTQLRIYNAVSSSVFDVAWMYSAIFR
jgi:hypothetical protein